MSRSLRQEPRTYPRPKDVVSIFNESQFFSFNIAYPQRQELDQSLRPFLKLEFSFLNPALPTETCSIRSFVSHLKQGEADTVIHCVSPVETAADKFSALVWRVLSKDRSADRGSIKNEPEMIRHLHDLCALEKYTTDRDFLKIVMSNYNHDKKRGELAGKYALQDAVGVHKTAAVGVQGTVLHPPL